MAVKAKKVNTNQYSDEVDNFQVDEVKKGKTVAKKDVKKASDKKNKKEPVKKVKSSGSINGWFKGVMKEMKNVRWPSRKEMIKYSVATIVFVLFFAVFFLVIEVIVSFLLNYFG